MGKLEKFRENEGFRCLYQPPVSYADRTPFFMRGVWHERGFGNGRPITLEAGCGTGAFSLGLASMFPERNFIGMDIKGARIWHGAKRVESEGIPNLLFLRARLEFCDRLFSEGEVDSIWITFPDPNVKRSAARRRLVHPSYLSVYSSFLRPDGVVSLKTDSDFLFRYALSVIARNSLRVVERSDDVHSDPALADSEAALLMTDYERRFVAEGRKIMFVSFSLDGKREFVE